MLCIKKFKLLNKTVLLRKDKRSSEDQGQEIRINYKITVYDQRFALYD